LKVLEGETDQSLHLGLLAFKDRALPNLAANIKCGNSLIGPDYFTGRLIPDAEELARVNAFDWQREFPAAMSAGGFDCVIGNPPWLMAGYYIGNEIDYLRAKSKTAEGKFDLYYIFLEKGHLLTKESGRFGMIVPNKFFHTRAAGQLRRFLRGSIEAIVDFREAQVFPGATNYSCIVTLARTNKSVVRYAKATTDLRIVWETTVDRKGLTAEPWSFAEKDKANLFAKMEAVGNPLEILVTRFGTGVQSGADRILTVTREQASELGLERDILRPVLRGRDVRRYAIAAVPKLLVFPYKTANKTFVLLSEKEIKSYRHIYQVLCNNQKALGARVWFGKGPVELSGNWWGMMYLDSYSAFTSPHILTPSLSNRSNFAVGEGTLFATGTAGVTSIIPREDIAEDLRYILALLNSRLLSFYVVAHSPVFSGNYFKFSAPYLRHLPIRRVDMSRPSDKAAHGRVVKLVDSMLALHKQAASAKSEAQRGAIQRQIGATDAEIDRLVYDLYGLTKEEIAIVEGANP
jgi:hypothetical protein